MQRAIPSVRQACRPPPSPLVPLQLLCLLLPPALPPVPSPPRRRPPSPFSAAVMPHRWFRVLSSLRAARRAAPAESLSSLPPKFCLRFPAVFPLPQRGRQSAVFLPLYRPLPSHWHPHFPLSPAVRRRASPRSFAPLLPFLSPLSRCSRPSHPGSLPPG